MPGNRAIELHSLFTEHPGVSAFPDPDVFQVFFGQGFKWNQNADSPLKDPILENRHMIGEGSIPLHGFENITDNRLMGLQDGSNVFLGGDVFAENRGIGRNRKNNFARCINTGNGLYLIMFLFVKILHQCFALIIQGNDGTHIGKIRKFKIETIEKSLDASCSLFR